MNETKFQTIAIDPLGEWARLCFSKDLGKESWDLETFKDIRNYSGYAERMCIILRKLKDIRDKHKVNIVVTAHENLDRIYAKGGAIGNKKVGVEASEPIAILGRPDIPGNTAPNEVMRAFDNIFRVKMVNGQIAWVAQKEAIGGGGNTWEVKDRFNACLIKNGYLPPSYEEIEKLALATPGVKENWNPPYLWLIYGPPGYKKTLQLKTFPKPIRLFDLDKGSTVLTKEINEGMFTVSQYDTEDHREYDRFIGDLFGCIVDAADLVKARRALGLK